MIPFERSLSGKLPPTLTKEISPLINGSLYPGQKGGRESQYWPRTDPVLTMLSGIGDEREYEKILRTSSAISSAWKQRKMGLMAQGSQVIVGESRSPAAKILRDFAEAFMANIDRHSVVRAETLNAIVYGWCPVEIQWTTDDFRHKGRAYYGVKSAVVRNPWDYRFTTDGKLAVVGPKGMEVYDAPEDVMRFMIATAGSTKTPHGDSILKPVWLLYFVAKQFEKMSGVAMQRALGLIIARRKQATSGAITPAPSDAKIDSELSLVLQKLNSNNMLVESQSYSLEVMQQANATKNIVDINEYFDEKCRIAIVGQNLSSKVDGGSFAATSAHVDILESYQQADAQEEKAWWNDGLLKHAVALNYGEVDSDDMPSWQSRMINRPNLAATSALYDMGARIDGRRLADGYNAPLFTGEETEDDVVLRKQAPPTLVAPAGPPALPVPQTDAEAAADDKGAPPDRGPVARTRTAQPTAHLDAAAAASERALDRATDKALDESADELAGYYAALEHAYLDAYPDPKA